MKLLVILSSIIFATGTLAFAEDKVGQNETLEEVHNLEQMLNALKFEKMQIESMVNAMVSSGRLSKEEAMTVKREIASIKEEDLENLRIQVIDKIKSKESLATK